MWDGTLSPSGFYLSEVHVKASAVRRALGGGLSRWKRCFHLGASCLIYTHPRELPVKVSFQKQMSFGRDCAFYSWGNGVLPRWLICMPSCSYQDVRTSVRGLLAPRRASAGLHGGLARWRVARPGADDDGEGVSVPHRGMHKSSR